MVLMLMGRKKGVAPWQTFPSQSYPLVNTSTWPVFKASHPTQDMAAHEANSSSRKSGSVQLRFLTGPWKSAAASNFLLAACCWSFSDSI